jgi:hypothetical protein
MSDDIRKALGDDPELHKRFEAFLVVRKPRPRAYIENLNQPVPQRLIDQVMGATKQPRSRR